MAVAPAEVNVLGGSERAATEEGGHAMITALPMTSPVGTDALHRVVLVVVDVVVAGVVGLSAVVTHDP